MITTAYNNKIKTTRITAYGFRNFDHSRIRSLLALKSHGKN
ncbi:transposase [Lactobacillus crispatus]|uniref:Transposase n=1 Tax=Lactobacillus mulieris TaxID=2508708 RepID=A0AAP3GYM5_9LACO|nr:MULTISPECIES: transposase [Lactobacillus]MCF1784394.1 transposase [Lactobacillus mulieris]MCF1798007.1 transposase [Lactobacillus mulieris]MCF1828445.1 transposase [Lactobacillus jensenii]MCT7749298.1 transposase [Lactobacillus crispatus]MCW8072266.1 transposase [Lactobacillus jensenii]